jgi:hypothetical protein
LGASPCPPKERVLKKNEVKVLSFGEDFGEALKTNGIKYKEREGSRYFVTNCMYEEKILLKAISLF